MTADDIVGNTDNQKGRYICAHEAGIWSGYVTFVTRITRVLHPWQVHGHRRHTCAHDLWSSQAVPALAKIFQTLYRRTTVSGSTNWRSVEDEFMSGERISIARCSFESTTNPEGKPGDPVRLGRNIGHE